MKRNVFLFAITGFVLLGLQSCMSDNLKDCDTSINPQGLKEVRFMSLRSNNGGAITRTNIEGSEWLLNDFIGIYMLDDGQSTITPNYAENKKFTATPQAIPSNADFYPASSDQAIYYPGSMPLRFIAYYPYRDNGTGANQINNYIYPINVGVQQNPAAIDLLYSDDVRGHDISQASYKVNLGFGHSLAKIVINVRPKAGTDIIISGMTGVINGMPTTATLNLEDSLLSNVGPKIPFNLLGIGVPNQTFYAGYDTSYQAIIIPHTTNGDDKIQLFSGGFRQFTWKIPAITFERGKVYTYNLTLAGETVIEFTGSITNWDPVPIVTDEVPHDKSGDSTRYIYANGFDTIDVSYIRAGDFIMGNKIEVQTSTDAPASPHKVTISAGFHISKTPVTVGQYAKFLNARNIGAPVSFYIPADVSDLLPSTTGTIMIAVASTGNLTWTGSKWDTNSADKDKPAAGVNWWGARAYAKWAGGELPTEAQWEYAARAELDTSKYYLDGSQNGATMAQYAWNDGVIHPVRNLDPNHWDLYDLFGNVFEWTLDASTAGADYSTGTSAVSDPCGTTGNIRIARGGYNSSPYSPRRITSRYSASALIPDYTGGNGFRVVFK